MFKFALQQQRERLSVFVSPLFCETTIEYSQRLWGIKWPWFFFFSSFFSFDDAVLVFARTLTILPAEAAQGSKSLLNQWLSVNINPSRPDHGQREKNNLNFYFHTSLWCTLLKAFIKPFEALQRSVKIKF